MRAGIAAANTSQVQYFDEPRRRDCYDDFYEQLVRVKNIAVLPFVDTAQELLVTYTTRADLEQPRALIGMKGIGLVSMGATPLRMPGMPGATTPWASRLTSET